ncbi:sperm-associated antigen 8 [Malurus melanocephalus]|uniref:sperm-associated antigen 8 n=1 Tax=Malurus melanocephalus TaxID=175006 RepID=UPI0025482B1C|nr:sperm-associated antigen 8 [Malurus melanocephalus]
MQPAAGRTRACGPGHLHRPPLGGLPRSHGSPTHPWERPLYRVRLDERVPEVPIVRLPCRTETLTTTAKRLREMSGTAELPQETSDTDDLPTETQPAEPSTEPSPETGKDTSETDKLPPWLGMWGTGAEKSPIELPVLPPIPPPPEEKPRRSRLTRNWQEEIIVDPLDSRPQKHLGSKDSQQGYQGLPLHQLLSSNTDSTPPKDYAPLRALLLGQGQRKAKLAAMLYEKYSKEMEEEIRPPPSPMESISTTHHDYNAMGFQSTPQPTTQPHDYLTEQPSSFWLEQARERPGDTTIFGRNVPFKKNTAFSTPITMYLGHPEPFNLNNPYDPLSSQLQPYRK